MKMHGIEMHDLGHKLEKGKEVPMTPRAEQDQVFYPTAYFSDKDMPIDKLEHGKTYRMAAIVHVKSKTLRDENGKKSSNVDLEFHHAGFEPHTKKKAEEMNDKELNDKIYEDK